MRSDWYPQESFAAFLTDNDPPALALYCPECARREFS
jgi:hypothetical protein